MALAQKYNFESKVAYCNMQLGHKLLEEFGYSGTQTQYKNFRDSHLLKICKIIYISVFVFAFQIILCKLSRHLLLERWIPEWILNKILNRNSFSPLLNHGENFHYTFCIIYLQLLELMFIEINTSWCDFSHYKKCYLFWRQFWYRTCFKIVLKVYYYMELMLVLSIVSPDSSSFIYLLKFTLNDCEIIHWPKDGKICFFLSEFVEWLDL